MLRTVQNILLQDSARLIEVLKLDSSSAQIEVQCLLQHLLKVPRAYLLTHPERRLNKPEQAQHDEWLQRRLHGEPIAYLLGEREFFGLNFKITRDTLIPRPETELLVELALQRVPGPLASSPPAPLPPACVVGASAPYNHGVPLAGAAGEGGRQAGRGCEFRVLDLGTGSGAIALAIAHACPTIEVVACDTSLAALEVARENAQRLGIDHATFMHGNWFEPCAAQRFHLIVSNPPYVAVNDPHLAELGFEPLSALTSGNDGLHDIRHIIQHARNYLHPGGWLLLEHGYDQASAVRKLLQQAGFNEVFSAPDLAGIERASGGRA